jgi:hypothetical protein
MCKAAILVGILAVGACVEPSIPEASATPRIIGNSLSPIAFASSQLATSILNSTNAATMGTTDASRKLLSFATTCALDARQSIDYTVGGVQYRAAGLMGIAPGWTTSALSAGDAAWVSACVVSRVNLTSAVIDVSARGDHAGYDTTIGEVADYHLEEGAFWGNVFTNLGAVTGYSCNGVDQVADDTIGDLPLRECAEWNGVAGSNASPCGFHYAGLCRTACSTATPPYDGCSFLGGSASSSVVTTFLYGTP